MRTGVVAIKNGCTSLASMTFIITVTILSCQREECSISYKSAKVVSALVNEVNEADSKFFLRGDSTVFFSKYDSGFFNLYSLELNSTARAKQITHNRDSFSPFLYKDQILNISDVNGDQNFVINTQADGLDPYNVYKWISSSPTGNYLLYQLANSNEIYLLQVNDQRKILLAEVRNKFNGFAFSDDQVNLAISYDNTLLNYNIKKQKITLLLTDTRTEKLNPHICKEDLYFVSNHESEFYQIYKINLNGNSTIKLVYSSNRDIRLPKILKNFLYYIEIHDSQYLLKRLNVPTRKVEDLTRKGVIYDYAISGNNKIIGVYSDFHTPKS